MTIILGIIIILFSFLALSVRNYEKELVGTLSKKDHPLLFLYPLAFFLQDKAGGFLKKNKIIPVSAKKSFANQEIKDKLKALYVGENAEKTVRIHRGKMLALALLLFLLFDAMAFFGSINKEGGKLIEGRYLQRPSWKEEDTSATLTALMKDAAGRLLHKELEVPVSTESLTGEEIEKEFDKGIAYLDKNILKENKSADSINSSLYFPKSIPDTKIKVNWSGNDTKVLGNDGSIHNEELKEKELIEVTAKLTLQDRSIILTRAFIVQPKAYTEEENAVKELKDALKEKDKDSRYEKRLSLPEGIPGYAVSWQEEKNNGAVKLFLLGLLAAGLSIPLTNREVSIKAEKRNKELLLDYPGIINKFLLLVNAGMSISNAWIKIAEDYWKKGGDKKYAFEEMAYTVKELKMGVSESTAYEEFGRRVKLMPYLRFSTLLAQNIQKGSPDFIRILEAETLKAFEERKEAAKKAGEEAGTKLLIPMVIMLALVMVIILVPAMSSFQL
ncbi:type II secretion system F family protein [Anaerocolumna xylanovorans]|uniref:Type II secretion system (T2SS), protein F n=1 Tax=Anaerocolumna xylanovorans DSM 12503 TaxID=1121345 RepID=A0A1M7YMP6_9FIRM|nr:type II secretion system F family protein [Anaerocolumna xylanovorans]SHO53865.1 Type II secretion system (T2SS), protein F [Anaerocolumna xylanovorans DSM 12503]